MKPSRARQIAVIFISWRTSDDEAGYQAAAAQMALLAKDQPGYCGLSSTRGADGQGITISYWENDEAAKSWRDHPEHALIREQGRAVWYSRYELQVARIERSYDWTRP